jgi:hypothetical protein
MRISVIMVHIDIVRAVHTTKPETCLFLDQKQRTVRFRANCTGSFNPLTLQGAQLMYKLYLKGHGNVNDFLIFCINWIGRGLLLNF